MKLFTFLNLSLSYVIAGNRFALMQSKLALIAVLRKHEVLPSSRTKYPVQLDPKQFILSAAGGVWVKLASIKTN